MEMKDKPQKYLYRVAKQEEKGGIPGPSSEAAGSPTTSIMNKSQQTEAALLEEILSKDNMIKAFNAVRKNKGGPGVDGMTVNGLRTFLKSHWLQVKSSLMQGTYKARAVKRIEIPKPNGGIRELGIPTVLDRLIQQAILQCLQPSIDATFSQNSYGFRPGRSAHDAIRELKKKVKSGYGYVVDIDLEKFFD